MVIESRVCASNLGVAGGVFVGAAKGEGEMWLCENMASICETEDDDDPEGGDDCEDGGDSD